jgi:membrane-anchored protein YejM (alkaline phosphatase superfamily)
MVLNIITSPDAMDSIQAGVTPFIALLFALIILIYFEIFIYRKINSLTNIKQQNLNQKLNKRIVLPLFFILLTDKLGFGFASLFSKNNIIAPIKVIPLYQPLTFTKIAAKLLGIRISSTIKLLKRFL